MQNAVRHLDLKTSSASVQQVVKESQLESVVRGIRVDSADNTAIPVVTNIIDPFAPFIPFATDKGLADSKQQVSGEDTQNESTIKPIATEKPVSETDAQSENPQLTTDESQTKRSHIVDPEPITNLNQKDDTEKNLGEKVAAKSFSSQIQRMVTNTRAPSSGTPSGE